MASDKSGLISTIRLGIKEINIDIYYHFPVEMSYVKS